MHLTEDHNDQKDDEFVQLLTFCQCNLRAFIISMTPNQTDADDLLQQVNLALWKKRHTYDPEQVFLRWAFAFASLEIRSYRSKSAKKRMWFCDEVLDSIAESYPEKKLFDEEHHNALSDCVDLLTPELRGLIAAYYSKKSTTKQLAEKFSKPLSTIYKKLARARDLLRSCMESKFSQAKHNVVGMSPPSQLPSAEASLLRQLISEKCDSTLTEERLKELSELLLNSHQAREEYWGQMIVHTNLDWQYLGKKQCEELLESILLEPSSWCDSTEKIQQENPPREDYLLKFRPYLRPGNIAASLLIVALGCWWINNGLQTANESNTHTQTTKKGVSVAKLEAYDANCVWSLGKPGNRKLDVMVSEGDTLWLDKGAADLQFSNGTVAQLEAPLILQVLSKDALRVLRGRVEIDVAKGSEGFVVETAFVEIIDLGTVFSVDVTLDGTDLAVFDGEVDLKIDTTSSMNSNWSKRLKAGEAVSINSDGKLSRLVNVNRVIHTSSDQPRLRQPIITSVSDNNKRNDLWGFYEVVPQGMREDSRAFVDRRHEWNGVGNQGLPDYLINGDYVKAFNDDKISPDLKIELTLNQPTKLYILLDKRTIPPEWLVRDFKDTGDIIGLDEAWHDPLDSKPGLSDFAETGPGNSIDRTFSVWVREVIEAGVVTLGPNGILSFDQKHGTRSGANMYGVVAQKMKTI